MATKILVGDCRQTLKQIPDKSIHCVITSPPYWGLRAYKGDPGMIGLESTWQEHLYNLLEVFNEVWRVMRDDATLWLNYGDAYAGNSKSFKNPRNLMQMPARLAIAMQEHGWILRSEIVWAKRNCMPESAKDRPTQTHEKMFLFAKKPKYFYDHVAVRTKAKDTTIARMKSKFSGPAEGMEHNAFTFVERLANKETKHDINTANLRNVWHLATESFKDAHFATFPTKLVEPCIKAGTSEHGVCAANGSPYKRIVKIHDPENRLGKGKGGWGNPKDKAVRDQKPSKEGAPQYLHGGWEPTCGAPYERLTKEKKEIIEYKNKSAQMAKENKNRYPICSSRKDRPKSFTPDTIGWNPTCECEGEIKPAIVLDPFGGAGTVSVVAERLGRDSIICEISPEYAEIARKRIEGENLPMFPTTIEVIK